MRMGTDVRVDGERSVSVPCTEDARDIRGAVDGREEAEIVRLPASNRNVCSSGRLPV